MATIERQEIVAGHELDAEVAEKVMGYVWVKHGEGYSSAHPGQRFLAAPSIFILNEGYPTPLFVKAEGDEPIVPDTGYDTSIPRFSTDISAAWDVLAAVRQWHGTRQAVFLEQLSEIILARLGSANPLGRLSLWGVMMHLEPSDICVAALKASEATTLQPRSAPLTD